METYDSTCCNFQDGSVTVLLQHQLSIFNHLPLNVRLTNAFQIPKAVPRY